MIDRNQIPTSWEVVKLGEVCENIEVVRRKEKCRDTEFLYLDIGGIDNSINKIQQPSQKGAMTRAMQYEIAFESRRDDINNFTPLGFV